MNIFKGFSPIMGKSAVYLPANSDSAKIDIIPNKYTHKHIS
jgi:hypothetical protein